ncbi:MAG TPA: cytochrome c oxidase assembly protein, partial [Candidatus Binatia bacterium]|nr:cytochrome c oxidase assembly protein [Candidatus Binatia bacterium]
AAAFILILPAAFLYSKNSSPQHSSRTEPFNTVEAYLKNAYARDFKKAYRYISLGDRQLKSERVYVREKGSFNGFPLAVTRKLSEFIELRPLETLREQDGHMRVKVEAKYPDANSLSAILLDWDEERLNALPSSMQRDILSTLDQMNRAGEIKTIEGEEEFTLVKEGTSWRVYLDWAAGIRVSYDAIVPPTESIEAVPVNKSTTIRPNELFTIAYRVKNRTAQTISTRITHRIEPDDVSQHLDIIDCALLLPVELRPGEESEFSTTYMVRGDLPEGTKELNVTYDFQVTH